MSSTPVADELHKMAELTRQTRLKREDYHKVNLGLATAAIFMLQADAR
eukprot:CAMPEP_0119055936 /NCGR_PEP_ID=MMETSP1178-20130426/649_1 /TAXON_ID=33656 /ORGANISM="unid sp, Strain CCMP2000" /LENGTH=47 /DNA_ID= /DNA_START= /DNA_END= /DNA_ORIENTATION=